ncbi:MAG: hypothetical protein JJLCMIEE_03466 [Acidimicrobiales bacterium]|nr:MAG: NAD(P)H-dependent oxidoreductase subunit E [Actinomycetota bacterium]MBV6510326.1 hypothetical protein [Acidimicrobiales bacterium]RIK07909.1 MAG: NAD(P)H-dependent oxidoreductase subunit E [Acidobacteriota bacterium]
MPRLTPENVRRAKEIISRYPRPRSALIPLLHLAQEQDGWLTEDAMEDVAELVGVTPAQVIGTASFYEMFKMEPVGRYVINVCTNISCLLLGGETLLQHAEATLGIKPGSTTEDGLFTLEDVECVAACTEAPCLQVNYRYFYRVTNDDFDRILADLRDGDLSRDIPEHGILSRVPQRIPTGKVANITPPEDQRVPVWIERAAPDKAAAGGDEA